MIKPRRSRRTRRGLGIEFTEVLGYNRGVSSPPLRKLRVVEVVVAVAFTLLLSYSAISVACNQNRAINSVRATAEIKALSHGLLGYYTDTGAYPRNADTDSLDPRNELQSASNADSEGRYKRACLHLYRELAGDREPRESPDGRRESDVNCYFAFDRSEVAASRDATGEFTAVQYIKDPWGNCYGYSTAGTAGAGTPAAPGKSLKGYNTSSFDLWSTAGGKPKMWIKNWK
jgi:hypothetical protein